MQFVILNQTGVDTRPVDCAIIAACRNGGVLPEELSDLFVLELVPDGVNELSTKTNRQCWRLTMADDE